MGYGLWLELAVRSTILLAGAELLLAGMRRATAELRHRLIVLTFVLLALLPVATAVLPAVPVPLWPHDPAARGSVMISTVSTRRTEEPSERSADTLLVLWAAGALLLVGRYVSGAFSIHGLSKRARLIEPGVAISNEIVLPITCGMIHSRVLLPWEATSWSPMRLSAVLAHERAHLRRRDVLMQGALHAIAALWWFQPLAWHLLRRLRIESELACDAEAIRGGLRPSEYATELLGVAATQSTKHTPVGAIAMARCGKLEDRLQSILNPQAASPSRTRAIGLVLALGAAELSATTLTLHSDSNPNFQGGSMLKSSFVSALLTSAGLSAATIAGTVHDGNGNAVPGATVVLSNPDTSGTQQTVTSSDGKFSLAGNAGGEYILRIEKPGFSSVMREFDVRADSTYDRDFTLGTEGSPAAGDPIGAGEKGPNPIHVGSAAAQDNLVQKVTPVYPKAAKMAGTQGTVELQAVISKDGVPAELRVVSSPSDDLSASALEAVRQWRYRPTLLNGNPIEVVTEIHIHYTLAR